MAKQRKNMFAGRTGRSMERPKTNYGYLKLPDNVNMFKPEGGTEVTFDILPYPVTDPEHMDNKKYADDAIVGELWWKRPLKVHRDVGPEGVQVICPTTIGKKCPICEYASKRRKEGAEWDELKEIFPKNRTLFLIVPTDAAECDVDYTEGEIHIMDQSDFTFLEFLEEEVSRDIDNEGFPDPYDGASLQVYWRKKKIGKKSSFAEASKIDFIERDQQYDDAFLDELPSLDDILVIKDYKELEAMYFGMENLDDEDVDNQELSDEKPVRERKTTRAPRSRDTSRKERAPRKKEDTIEEEEEEEKPTRTRKTATRKKPDPEPEPEPEEEVDEKPTRTTRTKPSAKEKLAGECPHGLKFGKDNDKYQECDTCKIWEECREAK